MRSNYWKLGIFLDVRCCHEKCISSLFNEASDYRMYDELHYWLILGNNIDSIVNIIDDTAFGVSTDFVVAESSSTDSFNLYDIYNVWKGGGGSLNITLMGYWSKLEKVNIILNKAKCLRRSNLNGISLRTSFYASKYKPPDMNITDYFQDYSTTSRDGLSKFGYIIVNHLSELYNFSVQYGIVAVWGKGDTIGPVIKALQNNNIDLTGSLVTMSTQRTYMVKYVHQSWPFRTCFIFRSPPTKDIKIGEVLKSFDVEVWYLIIIFSLITMWVTAVVLGFENSDNAIIRFSNSFLIFLAAICQQGTDIKMNRISMRIVFLSILIFSLLIYTYYSSGIVYIRLNDPIFKINDSLNEFAKIDIKMSSEYMVYFDLFMRKKDWETQIFYKKRWSRIPDSEQFMDPEIAIRLVQKGGFAYHMHPDVGYPIINRLYENREICELNEVHVAQPTLTAFAVSLNNSFAELMRIGLIKVSEVGLRHRQVLRWTSEKPKCLKNVLSASSVNIYEFSPHLLVLMIGMIFASLVYLIEIVIAKHIKIESLLPW